MANINVRRDVTDPFYRYKMERLQSKIEGKGNGIKTVIVNLSNVAQQLARPPSYVIKYFGFELGAQTNNNPADDRWIINGAHEAAKLQDYLDGFISKFVLCKKCKNPETDVNIKDGRILLDCKACGQRTDVDLRLKLSSFILKNQPKKGKKDKATKKAERRAKKANGEEEQNGGSGSNGDSGSDHGDENGDLELEAGSDDELTRRINAEAKDIEVVEPKEVEWSVDTSEEAVKARAKDLPDDLKRALVVEDGDEGADGPNAYDQLGTWIQETVKTKGGVSKVEDVEIYLKAKEFGIETKHRTLTVLAQTIFDDNMVKQIDNRAPMLKKMITSEKHEKAFLGGIERFVGNDKPNLIPQVSAILMNVYQNDLVSEEVLKGWGSKASKKYVDLATSKKVRKSATQFLEWLENAESDESEEESDDE
ncbi:Translation initiation factor IF2/IF5 [Lasiodiplodia theobromae]|uniref:Eukaryotic translation initiation factor 5 n=1 Tax=Lasiodiplodia theobromae TaxID=45133 RepID=A0A5N5DKJ4_9PEZI|nr:Eukaryotic translation initiation factor 5 [Lasiodiplodia theobromae]KAB2578405.1 Eukaryotic translation initiation factor 5 [Lasiodiplodia theobromae]KAF4544738.1 Eukaryotic translation initiation factor 5 [Lasiodiplodia theobromae]KAF9637889.1 Translation initiation factor IF2/IF5 [Lasiodiplodia theobromae]